MNRNFAVGFIKRASQYGLNEHQAITLLNKVANEEANEEVDKMIKSTPGEVAKRFIPKITPPATSGVLAPKVQAPVQPSPNEWFNSLGKTFTDGTNWIAKNIGDPVVDYTLNPLMTTLDDAAKFYGMLPDDRNVPDRASFSDRKTYPNEAMSRPLTNIANYLKGVNDKGTEYSRQGDIRAK